MTQQQMGLLGMAATIGLHLVIAYWFYRLHQRLHASQSADEVDRDIDQAIANVTCESASCSCADPKSIVQIGGAGFSGTFTAVCAEIAARHHHGMPLGHPELFTAVLDRGDEEYLAGLADELEREES